MYRYFCRKKRLCTATALFLIFATLFLLMLDNSVDFDIENGQKLREGIVQLLKRGAAGSVKFGSIIYSEDIPGNVNTSDKEYAVRNQNGANSDFLQNSRQTKLTSVNINTPKASSTDNARTEEKRETERLRFQWNRRERETAHFNRTLRGRAALTSVDVVKAVNENVDVTDKEWTPPPNPGEFGMGVKVDEDLLSREQKKQFQQSWEQHYFNEFVSNFISLHRTLPDPRDEECRDVQYQSDLPDAGVVIIFHNEAWSTLLRTVHSVLDRSPAHLLRQVVLVDDFSSLEHLKQPLEDYVAGLEKVKLVRTSEREGLIRARLIGLSHIIASVVVFLDSHCECTVGWLKPLLGRIAENSSTVVVPVIDTINDKTFEFQFQPASGTNVGTFTWQLTFAWMPIADRERQRRSRDIDPILTPTMAGGLFAIDRQYFYKLGTYDPGMRIWGGENLELSFRIWMCGGRLETIPCSHVGHVFRGHAPYSHGGLKNPISTNRERLAAVWLDEYQFYFHQRGQKHQQSVQADIGDVSERVELRQRLLCHSFAWFLEYVMPDLFVPADVIAHGPIYNEISGTCITKVEADFIGVKPCAQNTAEVSGVQKLETDDIKTLKWVQWSMNIGQWTVFQETNCLDYVPGSSWVTSWKCHSHGGNQIWRYLPEQKRLIHVLSKRCAEVTDDGSGLVMRICDAENPWQHWLWDTSPIPGPSWRKDKAKSARKSGFV